MRAACKLSGSIACAPRVRAEVRSNETTDSYRDAILNRKVDTASVRSSSPDHEALDEALHSIVVRSLSTHTVFLHGNSRCDVGDQATVVYVAVASFAHCRRSQYITQNQDKADDGLVVHLLGNGGRCTMSQHDMNIGACLSRHL